MTALTIARKEFRSFLNSPVAFIFLIIFIPAVYFGLTIFASDDYRVQEMKEWVSRTVDKAGESNTVENILRNKEKDESTNPTSSMDLEREVEFLKKELDRQEKLIEELRREIESLKD